MSAREFKFGDLIPRPIDGRKCIFSRRVTETNPPAIELLYEDNGINYLWMTEDELEPYLAPSSQPHVAAGRGWRERTKKAIENARDLSYVLGCVEERNESTSEMADAKADDVDFQVTIDALIAEVVELPPANDYFAFPYNNTHMSVLIGSTAVTDSKLITYEHALEVAAALISAATSYDPSA